MDELMQTLFEYIIENKMAKYRGETGYYLREKMEQYRSHEFTKQLSDEQLELFMELEDAYNVVHTADLEALFLASADLFHDLSQRT